MDTEKLFNYCFGCPPKIFPETAIITPVLPVKRFREHCDEAVSFSGRLYSGITASKNGAEFAVIHCGMGDRFMGDAVLLMDITSVRRIVFAGTCGGLNDCRIGDLIACRNAFNGEGFSRYHTGSFDMKNVFDAGELIPAAPAYTESLIEFLSERAPGGAVFRSGDIFTIGSLMAEEQKNMVSIEERGFKGIDLELSAVYHAARKTGREATGLALVSDLPLERPIWEQPAQKDKNGYVNRFSELVRFSVEFAVL